MRFNKYISFLAVLAIFMVATLFDTGRVLAISNTAPDPGDYTAGGGVHLVVSRGGSTNGLYAETSDVIVYATSPTVNLSFHNARSQCGSPPDSNDYAGTDFTVWRGANPVGVTLASINGDAAGCGTFTRTFTNPVSTDIGTSTYYVFFVRARLKPSASDAVNGFKISSNSGVVGFYSSSGSQFALQDRDGPASSLSNFDLKFAQDCSAVGNTQRIRMRWKDDDNGAGNQPISANLRMTVAEYDRITGVRTSRPLLFLNNNGTHNFLSTSGWVGNESSNSGGAGFADLNIDKDKKYVWTWQNVRRTNGIQFEIPKNSINYNVVCVVPPPQEIPVCRTPLATGLGTESILLSVYNVNPGAYTLPPCPPIPPPPPVRHPYLRIYGNDVVAGGGYGLGCSSNNETIEAYGEYSPPAPGHQNYRGSGSELAAFSPGVIEEFLPGARATVPRTALWEMSFANSNPPPGPSKNVPGTKRFGGGFGVASCPGAFPSTALFASIGGSTSVNSLSSGEYVRSGNLTLTAGQLANGKRLTIYVDGDLTITGNITNASSSWASAADIPLLKIYVMGDLKIHHGVSTLTGLFNTGGDGVGQIWTCTNGSTILDTSPATVDALASLCNTKLTIYGTLIGNRANFYRTFKDISDGTVGETHGPLSNIAETVVFSPDIYLALLSEQGTPTIDVSKIDSIRSLPPAF